MSGLRVSIPSLAASLPVRWLAPAGQLQVRAGSGPQPSSLRHNAAPDDPLMHFDAAFHFMNPVRMGQPAVARAGWDFRGKQ